MIMIHDDLDQDDHDQDDHDHEEQEFGNISGAGEGSGIWQRSARAERRGQPGCSTPTHRS